MAIRRCKTFATGGNPLKIILRKITQTFFKVNHFKATEKILSFIKRPSFAC